MKVVFYVEWDCHIAALLVEDDKDASEALLEKFAERGLEDDGSINWDNPILSHIKWGKTDSLYQAYVKTPLVREALLSELEAVGELTAVELPSGEWAVKVSDLTKGLVLGDRLDLEDQAAQALRNLLGSK